VSGSCEEDFARSSYVVVGAAADPGLRGLSGLSCHGTDLLSFSESFASPVDYGAFALWLSMMTQLHGEHLLRVKGILFVKDDPLPVVVQSVQHVVYPVRTLSVWPFAPPASKIVAITRGLERSFVDVFRESLRALAVDPTARLGFW